MFCSIEQLIFKSLNIFVYFIYVHAQSCLTVTPHTIARQAPLSVGFFRQDYWSGLLFPPSRDLACPGLNSHLLHR